MYYIIYILSWAEVKYARQGFVRGKKSSTSQHVGKIGGKQTRDSTRAKQNTTRQRLDNYFARNFIQVLSRGILFGRRAVSVFFSTFFAYVLLWKTFFPRRNHWRAYLTSAQDNKREGKRNNEWMNERMNEWMMNERMNEWMNEWIN